MSLENRSASSASSEPEQKLACEGLWMLFGKDPAGFIKKHGGAPTAEDCKREGIIAAVRNVSLAVHTGEIQVVMGLSGSGKSTLIRCLTRLLQPTGGSVLFAGQEIAHLSESELNPLRRYRMGMVFQDFGLLPNRTVLENVAFPLEVQGLERSQRYERAHEKIELVGLSGRENYYPRELSGGQQQRVGVARSLIIEPEVWFLDEPFSALDPLIRRDMQDEFLRIQSMLHKSIVFITHDFDEAMRVGDRIAIMRDGEVVQNATPEQILTAPADDYVRQFTLHAPRGSVMRVRSIMEAHAEPGASEGAVTDERAAISADASLDSVASHVFSSAHDRFAVVDSEGRPAGELHRTALLHALFGNAAATASAG